MIRKTTDPLSLSGRHWCFASAFAPEGSLASRLEGLIAQRCASLGSGSLRPSLAHLHPPEGLPGVSEAAARLAAAIQARESIAVFGDYDSDGVCGTALLVGFIETAGGRGRACLPHRMRDGYGLTAASAQRLVETGATLVLLVDNGTTAFDGLAVLQEAGVDVLVLDHHLPGASLPDVLALINPKAARGDYPFDELCGCGLAFKLAWATATVLCGQRRLPLRLRDYLVEATGLVALASVADVVPLRDENRVLVHFGLRALAASKLPGVQALLRQARVQSPLLAEDLAFRLAPRINAAGRLGDAAAAFELLTTRDSRRAELLARFLESENTRRQEQERTIFKCALAQLETAPAHWGICLSDLSWHPGIIGIVCSRLVERFGRPALLLSLRNGRARGSLRSPPGIHATKALAACSDLLLSFGGHARAAGLEARPDAVAELAARFDQAVAAQCETPAQARLTIAGTLSFSALRPDLVAGLQRLEPYGQANPRPLFASGPAEIEGMPRCSGADGEGLSLSLRQKRRVVRGWGHRLGHLLAQLCPEGVPLRRVEVVWRPRPRPPLDMIEVVDVRAIP